MNLYKYLFTKYIRQRSIIDYQLLVSVYSYLSPMSTPEEKRRREEEEEKKKRRREEEEEKESC